MNINNNNNSNIINLPYNNPFISTSSYPLITTSSSQLNQINNTPFL